MNFIAQNVPLTIMKYEHLKCSQLADLIYTVTDNSPFQLIV